MKLPQHKHFKGVGYISHVCDLCAKPITFLTYRGRSGEYCSNTCYEAAERKGTEMKTAKTTKVAVEKTTKRARPVDKTEVYEETTAPVPKKKVKKAAPAPPPVAKPGKGKFVNPYRESSALGVIFNVLKDGKPHSASEIEEACLAIGNNNGLGRIQTLAWVGRRDGLWDIKHTEDGGFIMQEA